MLKALDKVYKLSGRRENIAEDKHFDGEFVPYLKTIKNPDDLAQLSVACFNLSYPGNAGDDYIDAYFDRCFTLTIFRLGEIKGRAGQNALKSIKDRIQLDGAASLDYKTALELQNKINSTKP